LIDSNNNNIISISSSNLQQRRKQEQSETVIDMVVAECGSAKEEGEKTKELRHGGFLRSYHDKLDLEKTVMTTPAISHITDVEIMIHTLDEYEKMLTMFPTDYVKRAAILELKAQYLSRILCNSTDCSLEVITQLSSMLEYTLTRKELLEFKIECQMKFAEFQKELLPIGQTMTHIQQNNLLLNYNQSIRTDGTIIHDKIRRSEKSRSCRISI
jgi:hypothetical protein